MNRTNSLLAAGVLAVAVLTACDATNYHRTDFVIEVSDVLTPITISTTDPLPVTLLGVIGTNGCFSLLEIRSAWSGAEPHLVQVQAIGRYELRGEQCPAGVVYLDETVEIEPAQGTTFPIGELTVEVLRQVEEPIVRTVDVVDPTD